MEHLDWISRKKEKQKKIYWEGYGQDNLIGLLYQHPLQLYDNNDGEKERTVKYEIQLILCQ